MGTVSRHSARGACPSEDVLRSRSRRAPPVRWLLPVVLSLLGVLNAPGALAAVTGATITANPTEISEGGSSTFSVGLTVTNQPTESTTAAEVFVEVSGSATLGVDYEILGPNQVPGLLQFTSPNGDGFAPQTITVRALNDDVFSEDPEGVTLSISRCSWRGVTDTGDGVLLPVDGVCTGIGPPATVTILDITPVPTPVAVIEATDPNASKEGLDPGEFTVRLSEPAPAPGVSVGFSVGGTAVPGQDYSPLAGSVFITQGQSSAIIQVNPLAGPSNGNRTVIASLSAGTGYEVGAPSTATVTISPAAEVPESLAVLSGDGQIGSPGQPLQPFVVTASAGGSPSVGVPILWSIVSGAGSLSSSRTLTDAQGRASTVLTPSGSGEFSVQAQVEGTSVAVRFTTLLNPLASLPGLSGPQRAMARTLDTLCPRLNAIAGQRALTAGEQDLLTQCRVLISGSLTNPGAAAQGVAAITPEQASAPRKLTTRITGAQVDNISTRLTALRRGARGVSLRNLTFNLEGRRIDGGNIAGLLEQVAETGGGASADEAFPFERLGIFVNGNIDWGSKDRSANEDGFDFKTLGVTAGVDYRFLDGLVLGFAIGYGDSDVDIDANGGDLQAQSWSSTLYGTYYATDHFYIEGSATYGWGSFDQSRNISYSLLGGAREAKADFDGDQHALMAGAGYDLVRGAGILDLYGQVRYVKADLDGYREQGASGLDLSINSQESTSLEGVLGVNYTRSISTAKAVLLPQAWFEWLHEFDSGDDQVTGSFVNDPSRIPFALATDKFDSDYFRLGLGLGAQFGQGRTAFLSYDAAIGLNNYTQQAVTIGMRLEF